MLTSSEFKANHQVVASYKILSGAKAQADLWGGWEGELSTAPTDVIDLNGDKEASFSTTKVTIDDIQDAGRIIIDEPCLVAPTFKEMARVAKEAEKEILTQDDFAQGLFFAHVGAQGKGEKSTAVMTDLTSANFLAASHQPWDPGLHYAIDTKKHEFILYK